MPNREAYGIFLYTAIDSLTFLDDQWFWFLVVAPVQCHNVDLELVARWDVQVVNLSYKRINVSQ